MGFHRLALLLLPLGLVALFLPERASAQLCDRAGYTREANCPNEARDATGCCPAPPRRAPAGPSVTPPPADEACPMTQVRTASGRCCWPGQRGTASGCAGRPRSCPLGWEAHATGCLPAGTRARAMVLIPPVNPDGEAFVIDRTPVTVQAYRACVAAGACEWREPEHLCNGAQHRTHPMNCVSAAAAARYCSWAGGLRLPTAAEWERAAGAADGRRYPWGDALPDDRRAHWGRGCHRPPCTTPVGRRPQGASPYGVLDLAGNVWERTTEGVRGGHWSSSERELRIEAAEAPAEAAYVGFRCAGEGEDMDDDLERLGESETAVARRPLESAFVDLAGARRHRRAGAYAAAAGSFEAATATLARAGHTRAFVLRYHAAAARERAGETEAAAAQLAAYFEAGGTYPLRISAPWIGRRTRLAGWERTQPRWAQREGFRETLGEPPPSMPEESFEALLFDLVEATMEISFGRYLAGTGGYRAAIATLGDAGHAHAWTLRAHAAATLERNDDRERARAQYALYLESGGSDPPTLEGVTLSEELRRDADALRSEWGERLRAGQEALRRGAYADARLAFERYADDHGHPRRAEASVWLGRTHEAEGDTLRARLRYFAAVSLAPAGDPIGDDARARLGGILNRLAAGHDHTCAIVDARVICWGRNDYGQLGDGTRTHRDTPTTVRGLRDPVAIAAAGAHTCALSADGRVACWGGRYYGELRSGSRNSHATPTPIAGLRDSVAIAIGYGHACALRADGQVTCWGANDWGQLGHARTESTTPISVPGLTDAIAIAAGYAHTCALNASGQVTCWGRDDRGQLGDGGGTGGPTPTLVRRLTDTIAIAAGNHHTCAMSADRRVTCWGSNSSGQLGTGMSGMLTHRATPTRVHRLADTVAIAAAEGHTCAMSADARVSCWGDNRYGQLGDGSIDDRTTPTPVPGLSEPVALATGGNHTCAIRANGQIACWGDNRYGQLGDGSRTNRASPTRVSFHPR